MIQRNRPQRAAIAGTAVMAVLLLAACAAPAGADDPADAAETLVAAADPSLLPYNFTGDSGDWEGLNIDLAAALSEELGVTITFESAGFDTIIPGLTSGRYDLALTGMFDTKERQESVDFVDYLNANNNFLTSADFRDIADMDDLCGVTVGIPAGALESDLLASASETCVANGDPSITVNEYADLDATILALTSGRIEAAPNDTAANAYVLSHNEGSLKVSGSYLAEGYFAAAFPKDSELTQRVNDAFAAIMADGTYGEILADWGVEDRGMTEPIINGSPF